MIKILMISWFGIIGIKPSVEIRYFNSQKKSSQIDYSPSRKLAWNDFKPGIKKNNTAALTHTEISYSITWKNDTMQVNVSCIFDKMKSVVFEKTKTDYVLNHEQRHFDISYLFAQKFIATLKREPNLTVEKVDALYGRIMEEWNIYQSRYDADTELSVATFQQSLWNQMIDMQLKNLCGGDCK